MMRNCTLVHVWALLCEMQNCTFVHVWALLCVLFTYQNSGKQAERGIMLPHRCLHVIFGTTSDEVHLITHTGRQARPSVSYGEQWHQQPLNFQPQAHLLLPAFSCRGCNSLIPSRRLGDKRSSLICLRSRLRDLLILNPGMKLMLEHSVQWQCLSPWFICFAIPHRCLSNKLP